MRTPGYQPIELLPRTGRRVGGEPALDAADRPAVHEDAVLRQPTDDGIIGAIRGDGQSQAGPAAHGGDGPGGSVPQAADHHRGAGHHHEGGNRRPREKSLTKFKDTIRAKTRRTHGDSLPEIIASWNRTLEQRVEQQLSEIERVSRLQRFLSPQIASLILSSGDDRVLEDGEQVVHKHLH